VCAASLRTQKTEKKENKIGTPITNRRLRRRKSLCLQVHLTAQPLSALEESREKLLLASSYLPVSLRVRMKQLVSQWTELAILYINSVQKIQIWLITDKKIRYFNAILYGY